MARNSAIVLIKSPLYAKCCSKLENHVVSLAFVGEGPTFRNNLRRNICVSRVFVVYIPVIANTGIPVSEFGRGTKVGSDALNVLLRKPRFGGALRNRTSCVYELGRLAVCAICMFLKRYNLRLDIFLTRIWKHRPVWEFHFCLGGECRLTIWT